MSVIHILKDGSRVADIAGRVIQLEDAPQLYELIRNINAGSDKKQKNTYELNEVAK